MWGLEQLQPFYKWEGEYLYLLRGSHVNGANFVEGRAEKQRKTKGLLTFKPLVQAVPETSPTWTFTRMNQNILYLSLSCFEWQHKESFRL